MRAGSLDFGWPLALPPAGTYRCRIGGNDGQLTLIDGRATLDGAHLTLTADVASGEGGPAASGPVQVELLA
jgi:hypothetical protein